jgi:hypothetical protein
MICLSNMLTELAVLHPISGFVNGGYPPIAQDADHDADVGSVDEFRIGGRGKNVLVRWI